MHPASESTPRVSTGGRLHLPALDGARGLAVLLVLLDHASDAEFLGVVDFNRAGAYGVMLFFTLSAFLLSYLLFAQPEAELREPRTWWNYALRRVLRIVPLFTLALICWAWIESEFTPRDVANHLLLRDGQRHFWTIAVEFKFYFVLPALVFVAGVLWRKSRAWAIAAALALAAFLRFGLKPLEEAWSLTGDVWLNEYLEIFLIGAATGSLFAKLRSRTLMLEKLRWPFEICAWICLTLAILRIPSVYTLLFRPDAPLEDFDNNIDFFAILWPLFLVGTLWGKGGMQRVLTLAPLRWLGLVSYSAYLWHPFLLPYAKAMAPSHALRFPVFLMLVLLVAAVSYLLIERPFSKIRLTSRGNRGAVLASPVTA